MLETWSLTPTASNDRELYSLVTCIRGSTCCVRPYERRGGVRGVFDLIVEGLTDRERQDMLERMERLGLRRITEEEQRAFAVDILLPGQQDLSPTHRGTPTPVPDDDVSRFESEGDRALP